MWKRITGSLRTRILVSVCLICGVGTSITLGTIIISMYNSLMDRSRAEMITNIQNAAQKVEESNRSSVTIAITLATSQQSGYFGYRKETIRFLRNVLIENPELFDTYVIYEPNADKQDALYKNAEYHDSTGRFNVAWDMIDGKPVLVPGSNMESSSYYEGPRRLVLDGGSQRYVITEPYVYEGKMMVEHASPIVINNRFVGIGGCDRLLGSITLFLQSYKPYKSADFLLVSRLGGIIVGTNDSALRTRKYDEIEQKDILAELMRPENAGKVMRFTDPKEHKDFYFTCAHIPTGNWTLFMRVAHDELAAPIYSTLITIGIISFGLMVLLVVVLIWLVNSIVRPITMAASTARRVAAGDLTVNVPAGPADETGMLLESIRNMTDNLNDLVLQVQRTGVRVVSSATEIFASTRNLQGVATDQYEFANQVLTATREISATAGALKLTMESVRDISEHAKESAQSSREYLERMEHASSQMLRASRTISQKLGVISDKAGNVSKITTTINKISDQINILSINAAIEAEKAGEYGKGFSIVAREIRRLSDQTTEGTDDIEALINSMQTAVSLGVAEMDKFMRDVSSGVNELAGVNERIELIVTQVQDLAPRFGDVADSMTQQIQGVDHINESVMKLTQGAKQIEDSLTEFINVTSELKQEAESLKNQISSFKLRN